MLRVRGSIESLPSLTVGVSANKSRMFLSGWSAWLSFDLYSSPLDKLVGPLDGVCGSAI